MSARFQEAASRRGRGGETGGICARPPQKPHGELEGMRRNKLYTSGGGGEEEDKYTASKKLHVKGKRIYSKEGGIGHLPNTRLSLIIVNPQPLGGTQRITHKCSREWGRLWRL
jgi:hypothetical protein